MPAEAENIAFHAVSEFPHRLIPSAGGNSFSALI
jgi:hypothetical protein